MNRTKRMLIVGTSMAIMVGCSGEKDSDGSSKPKQAIEHEKPTANTRKAAAEREPVPPRFDPKAKAPPPPALTADQKAKIPRLSREDAALHSAFARLPLESKREAMMWRTAENMRRAKKAADEGTSFERVTNDELNAHALSILEKD